jgi:hypothetical protein
VTARVVRVTWRRYGGAGGGLWRVWFPNGEAFETPDHDRAIETATAAARAAHAVVEVEDTRPAQLALTQAEGLALAAAGTDPSWALVCDNAIARLAADGHPFDAYDLIAAGVPEPAHPNHWGPRLAAARAAGRIEPAGWTTSRRPTTRNSAVRLWRGVTHPIGVAS